MTLGSGLMKAILDAIHGEDDTLGGQAFTKLTAPLAWDEVGSMSVATTLRFGEYKDGLGNGRLLINGEIIDFDNRTDTTFSTLVRGLNVTCPHGGGDAENPGSSKILTHPEGSLVWDMSRNATATDHLWRTFLVDFALSGDLDIIASNLGLTKCVGLTDDQWREVIKALAYLPKQPINAFRIVLDAFVDAGVITSYEILEGPAATKPWTIRIKVELPILNELRGKFFLNSGESALVKAGGVTVDTEYTIIESPDATPLNSRPGGCPGFGPNGRTGVFGVYLVHELAGDVEFDTIRAGIRNGATNYFASISGAKEITINPALAVGDEVLIDYNAFEAHYTPGCDICFTEVKCEYDVLDTDFGWTVEERLDPDFPGPPAGDTSLIVHDEDYWAYLSDSFAVIKCILDQVRAAGIKLEVSNKV